ncbi:MAG: LamG domain-containing protein [Acidobacteriota bacterium]
MVALLTALLLTCGSLAAQSTVGFWRFEEGVADELATGPILDSAGSADGSVSGSATYRASEVPGSELALDFSGSNSAVRLPDGPAFRLSSLTIEACVRIDSFPNTNGLQQIFFRGDSRAGRDPFYLGLFNGANLIFQVANGGADTDPDNRDFLLGEVPESFLGEVIHVAGTLDDATGEFVAWVNGVPTRKTTNARPGEHDSYFEGGVSIGALFDGLGQGQPFNGLIDEVRLSSRALSPAEFVDCGNGQVQPTPTVTPEEQVAADGEFSSVARSADGRTAVVWQSGLDILGRLFGPNGAALGQPFQISSGSGTNSLPSAAFDATGRLAVVWNQSFGQALRTEAGETLLVGVTDSAVVGRFFDPTGAAETGEVVINSGGDASSQTPKVDLDDSGDAIVVWEDGDRVRGRKVDRRGRPAPATLELSSGPARQPVTATSSNGSFVVAYQASSGGLVGRAFDPLGAPVSEEFEIEPTVQAENPAVAMDDAGNFVVVWDEPGAGGRDVRGRRFAPNGDSLGPAFDLSADSGPDQSRPSVAMSSVGDFAAAWVADSLAANRAARSNGGNLVGRLFDPTGIPATGEVAVAETINGEEPSEPSVALDELDDVTVTFTRRRGNGRSTGVFKTSFEGQSGASNCVPGGESLCLQGGRFRVTTSWEDKQGASGVGQAVALTADTGYFWFFDASNVEMVVKILDGCPLNSRYWVFAGGLTDVEVKIRVEDTSTGQAKTYFNVQNQKFAPVQDTSAFATCTAGRSTSTVSDARTAAAADDALRSLEASMGQIGSRSTVACSDPGTLCLGGGRFEVRVDWSTAQSSGEGQPEVLTSDTGYFWFFDRDNVEMVLKILDGCGLNGHYWVFAGGLTDQGVTIEVTDSQTGQTVEYTNQRGVPFQPIQDTQALAVCP